MLLFVFPDIFQAESPEIDDASSVGFAFFKRNLELKLSVFHVFVGVEMFCVNVDLLFPPGYHDNCFLIIF